MTESMVHVGGWLGVGVADVTSDLTCLDGAGKWCVVAPFEGPPIAIKMRVWSQTPPPNASWPGVAGWISNTSESQYVAAVDRIRNHIAAGDVYQVNVCRLLSAECDDVDIAGLYASIRQSHSSPFGGLVRVADPRLPNGRIDIASASPELFLRRSGRMLWSSPMKGTAPPGVDFLPKDAAENVMIVDLVRNDLSMVCEPGSVEVEHLLERQSHPGVEQLVSTVRGELTATARWSGIFAAAFPPGSVTGAPKSSALRLIAETESPRSVYCGSIGLVDADAHTAELNVAIRTFWLEAGRLWFGTGAGITWGSDAKAEWQETELKAARLIAIAKRAHA